MKKNKNEFSNALEKMEAELLERSAQKKIENRRSKLVETNEDMKAAARSEAQKIEAEVARKGALRDKLGILLSIGVAVLTFIVPYYRKQPVDFWFSVIVGLCYVSFYFFYRNSR